MPRDSGRYVRTAERRAATSAQRLAFAEANARGYRITTTGYIEYTRGPNKGRLEHRVVMEAKLGRLLHASELVHHRDHDRRNNQPDNLELLSRQEHARLHAAEYSPLRSRNTIGQWNSEKVLSCQTV